MTASEQNPSHDDERLAFTTKRGIQFAIAQPGPTYLIPREALYEEGVAYDASGYREGPAGWQV